MRRTKLIFMKHVQQGIANRNPLNLLVRKNKRYLGTDTRLLDRKGICRFHNAVYCYRAAIIEICRFVVHLGANTPKKIIELWLPRDRNRREIYLACICGRSRLLPDEHISLSGMQIPRLLAAIARQETGTCILPETIYDIRKKFKV